MSIKGSFFIRKILKLSSSRCVDFSRGYGYREVAHHTPACSRGAGCYRTSTTRGYPATNRILQRGFPNSTSDISSGQIGCSIQLECQNEPTLSKICQYCKTFHQHFQQFRVQMFIPKLVAFIMTCSRVKTETQVSPLGGNFPLLLILGSRQMGFGTLNSPVPRVSCSNFIVYF